MESISDSDETYSILTVSEVKLNYTPDQIITKYDKSFVGWIRNPDTGSWMLPPWQYKLLELANFTLPDDDDAFFISKVLSLIRKAIEKQRLSAKRKFLIADCIRMHLYIEKKLALLEDVVNKGGGCISRKITNDDEDDVEDDSPIAKRLRRH